MTNDSSKSGWIYQQLPVEQGKSYELTGHWKPVINGYYEFGFDWKNSKNELIETYTPGGETVRETGTQYRPLTVSKIAPSGATHVDVYLYAGKGNIFIVDNLTFVEVNCNNQAAPTATPLPTSTPQPAATNTPLPTATNTPQPTATILPTNTPVPTATATVNSCQHPNIQNSDFEASSNNLPLHWQPRNGATLASDSDAFSGNLAARVESNSSNGGWIDQLASPVVGGEEYQLTGHFKPLTNGYFQLGLTWRDVNGTEVGSQEEEGIYERDSDFTYRAYRTVSGIAPANATQVEVWLYSGKGNKFIVDNISLKRVDCSGGQPASTPVSTIVPTSTPNPTATPVTPTTVPTNTPVVPTITTRPTNTPVSTSTRQPTATNTPPPTSTNTPWPTNTPRPTSTNTPWPTNTPRPTATNTPRPTATNTPRPTNTPTRIPPTSTPTPSEELIGQIGRRGSVLYNEWITVGFSFRHTFENPVIIAQASTISEESTTDRDKHPAAIVRIDDVTSDSFKFKVQTEPGAVFDSNLRTDVSWMVIEAGEWELNTGQGITTIQAGKTSTNATVNTNQQCNTNSPGWEGSFEEVRFEKAFDSSPIVLSQVQTLNQLTFLMTRHSQSDKNGNNGISDRNGFYLAMQEHDAAPDPSHTTEVIGWIAMEKGSGTWSNSQFIAGELAFPEQIDGANWWRWTGANANERVLSGVSTANGTNSVHSRSWESNGRHYLKLEEDTTLDCPSDPTHRHKNPETVDYFRMNGGGALYAYPSGSFQANAAENDLIMAEPGNIEPLTYSKGGGGYSSAPGEPLIGPVTAPVGYITQQAAPAPTITTRKTYHAGGSPIAQESYERPGTAARTDVLARQNEETHFIYTDHLGSANTLANAATGEVVHSARFYPFGELRSESDTLGTLTERGFTGHRENRDIGLTYMNARFYVPGIGRFASADTIVPDPTNPQNFNRFSYVLNNPLFYTDPSGHDQCAVEHNHNCKEDKVNECISNPSSCAQRHLMECLESGEICSSGNESKHQMSPISAEELQIMVAISQRDGIPFSILVQGRIQYEIYAEDPDILLRDMIDMVKEGQEAALDRVIDASIYGEYIQGEVIAYTILKQEGLQRAMDEAVSTGNQEEQIQIGWLIGSTNEHSGGPGGGASAWDHAINLADEETAETIIDKIKSWFE